MSIELLKSISTHRIKSAINKAQYCTIWVLITPPNRDIASPLAIKIMEVMFFQKWTVCSKNMCNSCLTFSMTNWDSV